MRTGLAALLVFGIGLMAGLFGLSGRAHATTTTLTGSVGSSGSPNAFAISLSASTVPAGTYTFDITDYASAHNFDLIDPDGNSVDKTPVSQTGTVTASWTVTLSPGTYTYRCDVHTSLKGTLTVTGTGTSTSTSTSTSTTTTTASTTNATTTVATTIGTTTTGGTTTAGTTTVPTTTTTGNGGGAALQVHIVSAHATRARVVVAVAANQLTRAFVVLKHGRKLLARAAGDGERLKLTLRPAHPLERGKRYVVRVKVTCCGTSATATKTIKIR